MSNTGRCIWKCRCYGHGNGYDGGLVLMSGTWKVHMSFIHLICPYGLHREFYQVIDVDNVDVLFDDSDLRFVKYRNSAKLIK